MIDNRPKMPIYYVIYYEKLIPCYLIKEGYIPCKDYRENEQDDYYAVYSQYQFCLSVSDKDIYKNKKQGIEMLKIKIEDKFNEKIKYAAEDRKTNLERLEHI